jgi:CheY-like chemotaxis protein
VPLRVLIVDDNVDHADSLATLVELWGHTPAVAYDGAAGLRAARERRPDCLILDINMPGLDGYTLAQEVRREPGLEQAKLVAVSAYSHADHARRAETAGFDYRLVKPAAPGELENLLTMIEALLKLAEKTEELARTNAESAERTEAAARKAESVAGEAKDLLKEVKAGLDEVKQEVQEIKQEVREVKEQVERAEKGQAEQRDEGEQWKRPS